MAIHGCVLCSECGAACPLCGTCICSNKSRDSKPIYLQQVMSYEQIIDYEKALLIQEKVKASYVKENRARVREEENLDKYYEWIDENKISTPVKAAWTVGTILYSGFLIVTSPIAVLTGIHVAETKCHSHLDTFLPFFAAVGWPLYWANELIPKKLRTKLGIPNF